MRDKQVHIECDMCGELFSEKSIRVINNTGNFCYGCKPTPDPDALLDAIKHGDIRLKHPLSSDDVDYQAHCEYYDTKPNDNDIGY